MSAPVTPAALDERGHNPLRPRSLSDVIGQQDAKALMQRAIDSCFDRRQPLPHTLLTGPSGIGKTTFANVLGVELGVDVFQIAAPISFDTLAELRTTMRDGAILFVDEIHLQAISERRGKESITQPEVLFGVMEDRVLTTATGVLDFPHITVVGATTDPGRLPEAFVNRFPLRPRLSKYTVDEIVRIVAWNAEVLDVNLTASAVRTLARASRGIPREANNLVTQAQLLNAANIVVDGDGALEVLHLARITPDGLTADMQGMLTFLLTRARQVTADREVKYQASVSTIATALGLSRDVKAVVLYVEPFLIEQGYVQVTHGGRRLTDAGIIRAKELQHA